MKTFAFFGIIFFWSGCYLHAEEDRYTFASLAKYINVEEKGDSVFIHYQTGAGMHGPRIVRTQVRGPIAYANDGSEKRVLFEYYFIEDVPHSTRAMETITITWQVTKADWSLWKKDKEFYVIHENDAPLSQEDIDLIKKQW